MSAFLFARLLVSAWAVSALTIWATPSVSAPYITLKDLVEARTIDSISVSRDGRQVAFRVVSPSLSRDRVEAQWLTGPTSGGDIIPVGTKAPVRRLPFFDNPINEKALWSSDGQSLYVLRSTDRGTQVHRLSAHGMDAMMTDDAGDVERFEISNDGARLIYWVRNTRASIAAAQAQDERIGIHFDRTTVTDGMPLTRNFRTEAGWTTLRREDDRAYRPAFAGPLRRKEMRLNPSMPATRRDAARTRSTSLGFTADRSTTDRSSTGDGWSIGFMPDNSPDQAVDDPAFRVEAERSGVRSACSATVCHGTASEVRMVSTDVGSNEVVILYEPPGTERAELHGWSPGSGKVRLIRAGDGALSGGSETSADNCQRAVDQIICAMARADQPVQLVRIDIATGRVVSVFDPNAALRRKRFPGVEYLSWTDSLGRSVSGVYVPAIGAAVPAPLVLTTYHCKGLLRGGVTQIAPEFMLSQMGIASLCVALNIANLNAPSPDGDARLKLHKAAIASYEAGIALLARRGEIDPDNVGIAGHSFTANAIAYAISHGAHFKAAIVGTGISIDPTSYFISAPSPDSWRRGDLLGLEGLPLPKDDKSGIWAAISPALNASRIKTPLLIQSPEVEYAMALELYSAIRDAGGIADMNVFTGDGHSIERSPVHQYWRMQRSLNWFSFWLQGSTRAQPELLAQVEHWQRLRAERDSRQEPLR